MLIRNRLQLVDLIFTQQQINKLAYLQDTNLGKVYLTQDSKMCIITDNTTCSSSKSSIHKLIVIFVSLNQVHFIIRCDKFDVLFT